LDGLGHVEKVSAHGVLGVVRPTGDDGLDNLPVLRDGSGGPSRDQDRAVLVAHRLGAQGVDEADGGPVSRELEESGMQVRVRIRRTEEVAVLEQPAMAREACLQTPDSSTVDPLGCLTHGKPFENRPRLQDLDRFLVTDVAYTCPPIRLADDEPVLLETDECGPHCAARHLERRRDLRFDEARVRRDVTVDDGFAEGVVVRVGRHGPTHTAETLRRSSTILFYSDMDLSVRSDHGERRGARAPVVAVLGLGEAGSRLAADLASAGLDVRGYDPVAPDDVQVPTRAPDPEAAVAGCDVVLSVNSARAALDAARASLPALRETTIYADLNTASPELKRELAELVAGVGVRFADVALLGPVPERGIRAPVLASGVGARAFADLLGPVGMPVDVISEQAGDAAALKLVRSVFMKGLAAAVVESMEAAEAAGYADWLEHEIEAMIGRPFLVRALEGSRKHAARRVDEMEAARDLLLDLGVEPRIAVASAEQLAALAAGLRTPSDIVVSDGDTRG
jgi:3-hydroxyisobutyrate dehydrogenase-like beta-hydroxyacid dehydrogenase